MSKKQSSKVILTTFLEMNLKKLNPAFWSFCHNFQGCTNRILRCVSVMAVICNFISYHPSQLGGRFRSHPVSYGGVAGCAPMVPCMARNAIVSLYFVWLYHRYRCCGDLLCGVGCVLIVGCKTQENPTWDSNVQQVWLCTCSWKDMSDIIFAGRALSVIWHQSGYILYMRYVCRNTYIILYNTYSII